MSIEKSHDMRYRDQKWASGTIYELDSIHNRWESQWMFCSYYLSYSYCSSKLVLAHAVLLKKNNLKSILCSSLSTFVSSIRTISMITLLIWTIDLSNHRWCVYCQNYVFQPKFGSYTCLGLKYYIAAKQIMNIKFLQLLFYQSNF